MDDLKAILDKILKSTPNYEEHTLKSQVFEAWPRIVGEHVARHTWPIKLLENNMLLIATESSAWLHNLKFLEAQILEKCHKELKGKRIAGLRFKLDTRPTTPHLRSSTSTPKGTFGKK